jgi:hypothetical protein
LRKKISRERDYFLDSGAMALAQSIERFWWDQGHHEVVAWVEPVEGVSREMQFAKGDRPRGRPRKDDPTAGKEIYAIRTNLIDGLPPREFWKLSNATKATSPTKNTELQITSAARKAEAERHSARLPKANVSVHIHNIGAPYCAECVAVLDLAA